MRRFKRKQFANSHVVMEGVITIADIRKMFKIPDDAKVTVDTPFLDYDIRAATHEFGPDGPMELKVTWERIE